MAKVGLEDIEQIKVFDWLRFMKLDDISFHVGNERKCSPQSGALFKRKGIKAGVSDIFIMRPMPPYSGLIIELKADNGKLSIEQSKFLFDMNKEGYFAACCFGADQAIDLICKYLNITRQHKQPLSPESQPDFLGEF